MKLSKEGEEESTSASWGWEQADAAFGIGQPIPLRDDQLQAVWLAHCLQLIFLRFCSGIGLAAIAAASPFSFWAP